jgi:uncharacterized radical SAM superfamily Fe-S cluster-containing enzyme
MPDRPYLFVELTNAVCSKCLRKVEAKVITQDGRVYLQKWCPEHRLERVLIADDEEYWRMTRRFVKPSQMPLRFNTPIRYGCPYDCGLCPDHEQHSCLTLVEVTDGCNLTCPVCYSESSPRRMGEHRSLEQIEFMLDCVVRNEGEPDVVQISGGEPTVHPQFWDIMDAARRRPIKHLMLNTNGLKIAADPEYARRLASYMPGFEVYLQFDSLKEEALRQLRGEDLRSVRMKALERLNEFDVSTTLVVTLRKGLNDGEIGRIIQFALEQPCVRGVTFQPVQIAGRVDLNGGFDPARDRLTVSEVRRKIVEQSGVFEAADVIPVPCHPDCLAMAYALKINGRVVPLTRMIPQEVLLQSEGSTIVYERSPGLREQLFKAFSTNHSPQSAMTSLKQLLCCLPLVDVPQCVTYRNVFRVIIMKFMDAYDLDVRSVKKSCVHIVHPDGRIIPFDTFNLFYRDRKEQRVLTPLRVLAGARA